MKKWILVMLACLVTMNMGSALAFDAADEITVLSREDGSGTRGAFVELLGVEVKNDDGEKVDMTTEEAIITNATAVMLTGVAGDETAIGYVSLGSMNDSVKALAVEGVAATVENVKTGDYKVSRPFNIVTGATVSDAAQDFINFIMSQEGQAVVEANGYIAVSEEAQPYQGKATGKIVVAGSSSVTPVMEKLKEAYVLHNSDVVIEVQQSDSTTGVQSTVEGICDIGMASRALKDSEVEKGIAATVIAMDGIAVIVHPSNPTETLSKESIRQIFTGEVSKWQEVQ